MIAFTHIALGSGSAATCHACGAPVAASVRTSAQVGADISAAASGWTAGPGPNISFVGPEPFSHPELPRLIAAAALAGCERIRLRTDGGALAVGGNAAGACQAGVRHIELVLLAGDAATHDKLAARPGLYDAAMAGAGAFSAAARTAAEPIAITGFVPLCRHTAAGLTATVLAFARLGAVAVLVEPVDGYELAPAIAADALRAATVSGVALHGPGVSPFSAEPWSLARAES